MSQVSACGVQSVTATFAGLYIFFLPKYCSEMNRIENEWQQIKSQELGGQIFEDEYDLAVAVMEGVQSRCQGRGDVIERFKFNST